MIEAIEEKLKENIKCIHQKHIIFRGAAGGPQYTYHTMDRNWKKPRARLVSPNF